MKKIFKKNLLLILFILFIILCEIFPVSSAIIAEGTFSYDSAKIPIQNISSAIVEKVLVKNGNKVSANEKIIELNSVKEISDQNIVKLKLFKSLMERQVLELESSIVNSKKIEYLKMQNKLIIKNFDQKELNKFSYILINSQNQIKSFLKKYINEIKIFNDKINNNFLSIKSNKKKLYLIRKQLENYQFLLANSYIEDSYYNDLKNKELDIVLNIESLNIESKILVQQKEIFREDQLIQLSKQIMEASLEIEIDEQEVKVFNDIVKRTIIYSPIDGFIEDLTVFNKGDVVENGKIIANILPKNPQLNIIAKLKPVDIDNISNDQNVEIYAKNFYEKNIPKISGKIISISRDVKFDQNVQQFFYEIKIAVNNDLLSNYEIIAGMPVDVFINQSKRSLLSYFYSPILKSLKYSLNEI